MVGHAAQTFFRKSEHLRDVEHGDKVHEQFRYVQSELREQQPEALFKCCAESKMSNSGSQARQRLLAPIRSVSSFQSF
jgi:hypothetical protein